MTKYVDVIIEDNITDAIVDKIVQDLQDNLSKLKKERIREKKVKNRTYPYLGKNEEGSIFLIIDKNKGIVLHYGFSSILSIGTSLTVFEETLDRIPLYTLII